MSYFFVFLLSVGSPLPSNQPRSSVHVLRGRLAAALGDFRTFRDALVLTRQVGLFCPLFSLASEVTNSIFQRKTLEPDWYWIFESDTSTDFSGVKFTDYRYGGQYSEFIRWNENGPQTLQ